VSAGPGGAAAPLGIATKLAYGIGGLGDSVKTFCFTTFLLFYYTSVLELSGTLLGIAMAVGLAWDAVVDPFIGHMSDRSTSRLGRRHVFMLAGSVVAGLGFMAVFNPPSGMSGAALFTWLLMTSLVVRSANSLFLVPYFALGSELTPDYHERTSLSGFRAAAVLVGTLTVTAAAFLVFLRNGTNGGVDGKFLRESYESMGMAFGLVIVVTGLMATFGTLRERSRLPSVDLHVSDLRGNIRGALGHRCFRLLIAASALSLTATAVNAALLLHYLTYHAKVPSNEPIGLTFGGFYVGALVGVAVWVRLCRLYDKHRVYAAATMASGVIMSSGYWLIGDGRPFGTGNVVAIVVLTGLAGFFVIAGAVVAPSMMADVTAFDEQTAGRRRDGTFFGIYSFGQQMSGGLAVLIAGVLVDRFAGLVPGQAEQSVATVERIAMISSLVPAALQIAAGLAMLRYDLRPASSPSEVVLAAPVAAQLDSDPLL
jgi:GPH family glycoside/pentoside/hexuronide:cation symporter